MGSFFPRFFLFYILYQKPNVFKLWTLHLMLNICYKTVSVSLTPTVFSNDLSWMYTNIRNKSEYYHSISMQIIVLGFTISFCALFIISLNKLFIYRWHICLRLCHPTIPIFLWQQQQKKVHSINYPKLPLYWQYVLITPKYKHTHLVQYVSIVTASNDTLTFYFRFEIITYTILEHTCTT